MHPKEEKSKQNKDAYDRRIARQRTDWKTLDRIVLDREKSDNQLDKDSEAMGTSKSWFDPSKWVDSKEDREEVRKFLNPDPEDK